MAENNDMTIDSLQIEIASSSAKAEQSIDRLCASLMGLNTPLKKIGNNVGNLRKMITTLSTLQNFKMPNLSKTVDELERISKIDFSKLQGKTIDFNITVSGVSKMERMKYAIMDVESVAEQESKKIAAEFEKAFTLDKSTTKRIQTDIKAMFNEIAKDENGGGFELNDIFKTINESGKVTRSTFNEYIGGISDDLAKEYSDFIDFVRKHPINSKDIIGYEGSGKGFKGANSVKENWFQGGFGKFISKNGYHVDGDYFDDLVSIFPTITASIDRAVEGELGGIFRILNEAKSYLEKEVSKSETDTFKNSFVNDKYVDIIKQVNDIKNQSLKESASKIPLNLVIDESRIEKQITNAIKNAVARAKEIDYGKIDLKLAVNTAALKQDIKDSIGKIDPSSMTDVSNALKNMTRAYSVISKTDIKGSGFNGFANGIKNIVDASNKFDINTFNSMSDSTEKFARELSGIDAKTSGVASLANGIARLITASSEFNPSSFNEVSKAIHKLCDDLRNAGKDTELTSSFARAISSLISTVNKFDDSSKNFASVTSELSNLFTTISNIPISDNVAQTANALAELSKNGRIASSSMNDMASQITNNNREVQIAKNVFNTLGDSLKTFVSLIKKIGSALSNAINKTLTTSLNVFLSTIKKIGASLKTLGSEITKLNSKFIKFAGVGLNNAISGIKNLWKELSGAKENVNSVNSLQFSFKNLLTTIIGFRGITGVFNWAKEALTLGGDITEIDHIVESVFGENMTGYIENWSRNAIKNFGIAQGAAKQYAGTLNAMFKASNISSDKSSVMALKMVELAGDLSAFYNIDTADAYQKIQAGLAGMVRPLRSLGLDLSVASLQEYALAQGINKSWNEMSQAEKVMLRYQYLLDHTTMQAGDFQKTSLSLSNQIRILRANLQAITTELGVGFAAAIRHVVILLNKLLEKVLVVAKAFSTFMQTLFGKYKGGAGGFVLDDYGIGDETEDNLSGIAESANDVSDGLSDSDEAAKKLKKDLSVLPFDELNQLSKDLEQSTTKNNDKSPSGGTYEPSIGNMDDLMDGMFDLDLDGLESPLGKLEEYISAWAKRIKEQFDKKNWDGLGREVAKGINDFVDYLLKIFDPEAAKNKIGEWIDAFTTAFNSFIDELHFDDIGTLIGEGIDVIISSVNRLIEGIDWKRIGEQFASGANSLVTAVPWEEIGEFFANKLNAIWNIAEGFASNFEWGKLGESLARGANAFVEQIDFDSLVNFVSNGLNGIADAIKDFVNNFHWLDFAEKLAKGANDLLSKIDFEKIAETMALGLNKIVAAIDKLIKDFHWSELGEKFADWANKLLEKVDFYAIGKTMADGLNGITLAVSSFINKFKWDLLGNKLADWANGLVDNIDFNLIATTIADGLNGISETVYSFASNFKWAEAGQKLAEGSNQLISHIDIEGICRSLGTMLNGIFMTAYNYVSGFDWKSLGSMFAKGINSLVETTDFELIAKTVYTGLNGIIDSIRQFFADLDVETAGNKLGAAFSKMINGVKWEDLGKGLAEIWNKAWSFLKEFISNLGTYDVRVEGLYSFNNISQGDVDKALKKGTGIGQALHDALKGAIESVRVEDMVDSINTLVQKIAQDISIAFGDQKLWYDIGHKIGEALSGIVGNKDTMSDAANAVKSISDGLFALFAGAIDGLKEHSEEIREGITTFISGLPWDAILGTMSVILAGKIAAKIPLIISGMLIKNALISAIKGSLKDVAEDEAVSSAGGGVFKGVIHGAETLKDKLATVLPKAIETLKTSFNGLIEILGAEGVAGSVLGGLLLAGKAISELQDKMSGGNGMLTPEGKVVDDFLTQLQQMGAISEDVKNKLFELKEAWEEGTITQAEFAEQFKTTLEEAGVSAETAATQVQKISSTGYESKEAVDFLSEAVQGLSSNIDSSQAVYDTLGITGEEAFNKIKSALGLVDASMGDMYGTLTNDFVTAYQESGNSAVEALSAVEEKWGGIEGYPEKIKSAIDDNLGAGAFDTFINAVNNTGEAFETTSGKVDTYGNSVKTAGELAQTATGHTDAYNEATGKSPSLIETLLPIIGGLASKFLASFGKKDQYYSTMETNIDETGKAVNDKGNIVTSAIKKMADDTLEAFKSGIANFKTEAEGIPTGTASGIEEKQQEPVNMVQQMSEMMQEKFALHNGIHSPSTVYSEMSENIPLGVAQGITNKQSDTLVAVVNLVNAMREKFEAHLTIIGTMLNSGGADIIDKLISGIQSKESEVSNQIEEIKTVLETLNDKTKEIADSAIESGTEIVGGLVEGMSSRTDALDSVVSDIAEILSGFANFIIEFRETIEEESRGITDGIINGLEDGINNISNSLDDITQKFDDFTNDLSSVSYEFENIGREIMSSLQYGINSVDLQLPHIDVDWQQYTYGDGGWFELPSFSVNWFARGGLFTNPNIVGLGEAGNEAVLPLENKRTMNMIADAIVSNSSGIGLDEQSLVDAIAQGYVRAMMANQGNQQQPIINVVCKTENDEVLFRAVQRGRESVEYRSNPTMQYGF